MCIRDRYQRRVHGAQEQQINEKEDIQKDDGDGDFENYMNQKIAEHQKNNKLGEGRPESKHGRPSNKLQAQSKNQMGNNYMEENYDGDQDLSNKLQEQHQQLKQDVDNYCLLYTSPSPRDQA
eukprot:TRINITY_DN2964_c0_g1_i2.p2 TRINITY_DN2964_c0_g1~~TRINITY_DN2964_c0_g1_i2.p2  ORF type:complete len:122 (+),score=34.93 TRINITY_DN2964_c0_g1_i2:157-522(+)